MRKPRRPLIDRFVSKIDFDADGGCWQWTAASTHGYGVIGLGRRVDGTAQTHRVVMELVVEPIPHGLHVDHLCNNRMCVNPDHLEVVTQAENNRRQRERLGPATHCKRGHEFTDENTIRKPKQRMCRACYELRAGQARRDAA